MAFCFVHPIMQINTRKFWMLNNKELLQFVEAILEKWFIVYLYSNNCIPPNGGNTKAYKPHVDTPRYIPNYHQSIVAMITMDDYTEVNGATGFFLHRRICRKNQMTIIFTMLPPEWQYQKEQFVFLIRKYGMLQALIFLKTGELVY